MRPISNVVDVTNYVMHALGSPLHAFDFDSSPAGGSSCGARKKGERLRTLDGAGPRARAGRPPDHRRRAAGRDRRDHGRRGDGGRRVDDVGACSRLRTSSPSASCGRPSGCACARKASNRWEKGVDPEARRQAAQLRDRAARRRLPARAGSGTPTSAATYRSLRWSLTARSGPTRCSASRPPAGRAAPRPRAPGVRASAATGTCAFPRGAQATSPGRSTSSKRSRAFDLETCRHAAAAHRAHVRPAHRSPAHPPAHPGHARRLRLRGGVHVEPVPDDPGTRRRPAARSRSPASRPFCARRSPTVSRSRAARTSTRATRTSRSSSSRTCTCRAASSCPTNAGTSVASSKAGSRSRRATVEGLYAALEVEPSFRRGGRLARRPVVALVPPRAGSLGARAGPARRLGRIRARCRCPRRSRPRR